MKGRLALTAMAIAIFLIQPMALAADVYVVSSMANVRAGGGMEYPVISQAVRGQRLELLKEEGGWSNVRLPNGIEGWIYSQLLSSSPTQEAAIDAQEKARHHINLGNEYFYKGLHEEAMGQYRKVLELIKDDADAHYNIANSYYKEGLIDKAVEKYLKTISIKPDHLPARNNLALIYFEQGKYSRAVEEWEKALEYDPGYLEVNYNLAQGYEKIDMDKAVKQWRRYLELVKNSPEENEFVSMVREHLERLQGE